MTEEQIKHMVDRFLGWNLPSNFSPDAGISYTRPDYPSSWSPSGTNLFDATQADAMVRYMIEGIPEPESRVRAKTAYNAFRNGITGNAPNPVPAWDEAPAWVRDVVRVAYLQGQLDR